MRIRHKLNLNMSFTAVGMIAIAAFSLSGMKYVQSKLHVLTERSTPYQVKTISLQRALQEHTANLLKVSTATTTEELSTLKSETTKSLEEVKQLSKDVASFKGETPGAKLAELESITNEVAATIAERIQAEAAGRAAEAQINEKLQLITHSLQRIDSGMKRSQKKLVSELSSTNDSVKRSSLKANLAQSVLNSLGEMRTAILEIQAADQNAAVDAAQAKVVAAAQAVTKSFFMRAERNSAVGKELSAGVAEVVKQFSGTDTLADKKNGLLQHPDEAARKQLSHDLNAAAQKVARLGTLVHDYSTNVTNASKEEGKQFDRSLENSVILSETLASNSDLVGIGAEIKATVREMSGARTSQELDRLRQKADVFLAKANALLRQRMKNVDGTAGVVGSLAEVRRVLLMQGGVVAKLQNILSVNQKVTQLNDKLKHIVKEQRKEGEIGITSARSDQEEAIKAVNNVFRSSILGVTALGAIVVVAGILFSFFLGRSITRPISELTNLAECFGNGKFNVKMDGSRKDEFGVLAGHFNTAADRLKEIVTDLKGAVARLTDSSLQLTSTSGRLIEGSHQQLAQAVQSATALEEMTSTIGEVAKNAVQAANATKDASGAAIDGKTTVEKAVAGMQKIAASVTAAAETIQQLGENSNQIGSIVNVINEIADQTNLLALNAAIEAARAGESGKGFAVVAEEVRNLAYRTTEATQEIALMIDKIQGDTDVSVKTMATGKLLVAEGVELAHEASKALETIVTVSDKGAEMVELIATASEQQTNVAHQVSAGVDRMADLSKAADADSGNVSSEAQALAGIAEDINRKVSWFQLQG